MIDTNALGRAFDHSTTYMHPTAKQKVFFMTDLVNAMTGAVCLLRSFRMLNNKEYSYHMEPER